MEIGNVPLHEKDIWSCCQICGDDILVHSPQIPSTLQSLVGTSLCTALIIWRDPSPSPSASNKNIHSHYHWLLILVKILDIGYDRWVFDKDFSIQCRCWHHCPHWEEERRPTGNYDVDKWTILMVWAFWGREVIQFKL